MVSTVGRLQNGSGDIVQFVRDGAEEAVRIRVGHQRLLREAAGQKGVIQALTVVLHAVAAEPAPAAALDQLAGDAHPFFQAVGAVAHLRDNAGKLMSKIVLAGEVPPAVIQCQVASTDAAGLYVYPNGAVRDCRAFIGFPHFQPAGSQ